MRFDYGKRLITYILTAAIALSQPLSVAAAGKPFSSDPEAWKEIRDPRDNGESVTWDCIWFGSYWQYTDSNGDGKVTRDDEKDPVKWRVLDIDEDGEALLLSDKLLEIEKYNALPTGCTWETSTLRSFLNNYGLSSNNVKIDYSGEGFLKNAFSEEESDAISLTDVDNPQNPVYGSGGGNSTADKIFCLSIAEAMDADYGFKAVDFTKPSSDLKLYITDNDPGRTTETTDYVRDRSSSQVTSGKYHQWWLRSPGRAVGYASRTDEKGAVNAHGNQFDNPITAVRPALRINLKDAPFLWRNAGTVRSDGLVEEQGKPVLSVSILTQRTVKTGSRIKPEYDIFPGDAENIRVSWSSSNERVATVDAHGEVTALEPGEAEITLTTEDRGIEAVCMLSVVAMDGIADPYSYSDETTWDCIWFGNYWQDSHPSNSGKVTRSDSKDPVKWRVLDVDEKGNALLLSDRLVDIEPYNTENNNTTWEECTLRSFLNSYGSAYNSCKKDYGTDGFLSNAFSEEETAVILSTEVENPANPAFGTPGGYNTKDKVFCLSVTEALEPCYGFSECDLTYPGTGTNYYTAADSARVADATLFSGGKEIVPQDPSVKRMGWWLRSPGSSGERAASVSSNGAVYADYVDVDDEHTFVRPALRLNLNSGSNFWRYAGTVSSTGIIDQVGPAVTGISLPEGRTIREGESTALVPYIKPAAAVNKDVIWKTSNGNVAVVDENGRVSAVAKGTASITAETVDGGYSAACNIKVAGPDEMASPGSSTGNTVWDCVWFGNYWQDDDPGSEEKKKIPLKWRILDMDDKGNVLLLSDRLIDVEKYNNSDASVTWEKSALRSFLNSLGPDFNAGKTDFSENGFLNNAFSEEEINAIFETGVENRCNPVYGTPGGNDTDDRVFCLSISEAVDPDFGFSENEFVKTASETGDRTDADPSRKAIITDHAEEKEGYSGEDEERYGIWWLRSPGRNNERAAAVNSDGVVCADCEKVNKDHVFVRPALRMNLSSSKTLWKNAGTVNSDGTVIQVGPEVSGVSIVPHECYVELQKNFTLSAQIVPFNAEDKTVHWRSSDDSVAAVDENGVVTGVKVGKASVTATAADGKTFDTCEVTVAIRVKGITLSPNVITVLTGDSSELRYETEPSDATEKGVVWKSSDESIVRVDNAGKITGIGVGKATVTVKTLDGGFTAECKVTVNPVPVEKVTISKTECSLEVLKTVKLSAQVEPDNATYKTITWRSSDDSIAVVDNNGNVTAKNTGTVRILAEAAGGVTGVCILTVLNKSDINGPVIKNGLSTWDCVWFGHYWQNADTDNDGKVTKKDGKESIKWRVLDIDEKGVALLLSDKLVDIERYNSKENAFISWEKSSVRSFLNSYGTSYNECEKDYFLDGFMNNAFLSAEREAIEVSSLSNGVNPVFGTAGGNDTRDKVFCLSMGEVRNEAYGFTVNSFVNPPSEKPYYTDGDRSRMAVSTGFTGGKEGFNGSPAGISGSWWLRTPGKSSRFGAIVDNRGAVCADGHNAYFKNTSVRPAIRLDLNAASSLWDYAGTVCSDGTVKEKPAKTPVIISVAEIRVEPQKKRIIVGETVSLTAEVIPADASEKAYGWTTSDVKIATVDDKGVVRGTGDGEATITAASPDGVHKGTCLITVKSVPVTGVKIVTPGTSIVDVGGSITLNAVISPANATNKKVTWKSSDEEIATVDENGKVSGIKEGEVKITVTAEDSKKEKDTEGGDKKDPITADCTLTVKKVPVTGVIIEAKEKTVKVGSTITLTAKVLPENATNKSVKWESLSSNIATVDKSGAVKGNTVGTVTIKATAEDSKAITATCTVTVVPVPVTGVKISAKDGNRVGVGSSIRLTADVLPGNATNREVTWASLSSNIAIVDKDGWVTGRKDGEAVITVRTKDGGFTDRITVTVELPKVKMEVLESDRELDMLPGEVRRLNVNSDGVYVYGVKYTILNPDSSDAKYISLKNGVVTARDPGKYNHAEVEILAEYCSQSENGEEDSETFTVRVDGEVPENVPIKVGKKKYGISAPKKINMTVDPFKDTKKRIAVSIPSSLRNEDCQVTGTVLTEGVLRTDSENALPDPVYSNVDRKKAAKAYFDITPLEAGATYIEWTMEQEFKSGGGESGDGDTITKTTKAYTKVIVKKPLTSISINSGPDIELGVGEGERLIVTTTKRNTDPKELSFRVKMKKGKGIRVSKSGFVVATMPNAEAVVTVKSGKYSSSVTVRSTGTPEDEYYYDLTMNKTVVTAKIPKPGKYTEIPLKLSVKPISPKIKTGETKKKPLQPESEDLDWEVIDPVSGENIALVLDLNFDDESEDYWDEDYDDEDDDEDDDDDDPLDGVILVPDYKGKCWISIGKNVPPGCYTVVARVWDDTPDIDDEKYALPENETVCCELIVK